MNEYIAYCGLNCEACEARLATIHHDDALRRRVAKGSCAEMGTCEKLAAIIGNNPDAIKNLKG